MFLHPLLVGLHVRMSGQLFHTTRFLVSQIGYDTFYKSYGSTDLWGCKAPAAGPVELIQLSRNSSLTCFSCSTSPALQADCTRLKAQELLLPYTGRHSACATLSKCSHTLQSSLCSLDALVQYGSSGMTRMSASYLPTYQWNRRQHQGSE